MDISVIFSHIPYVYRMGFRVGSATSKMGIPSIVDVSVLFLDMYTDTLAASTVGLDR